MKRLLALTLSAALLAALGGCGGAPSSGTTASPSSSQPPAAQSNPSVPPSAQTASSIPPSSDPSGTAVYRGIVTSCWGMRGNMTVTLAQDSGDSQPAAAMQFHSDQKDFAPELHQLAEVCYRADSADASGPNPIYPIVSAKILPEKAQQKGSLIPLGDLTLKNRASEVYPSDALRVILALTNNSSQPVALHNYYLLEAADGTGYRAASITHADDDFASLDAVSYQFLIQPGETRRVGAYVGAIRQLDPKTQQERLPVGKYRITLMLSDGVPLATEFTVKAAEDIPEDTSSVEMKTPLPVYKGNEETIAFTIANKTSQELAYGARQGLERLVDNVWMEYPPLAPIPVPEIAIVLAPNSTNTELVRLADYPRPLPAGSYRIVKGIDTKHFAYFDVK